jgi:hypothetical protein
VLQRDAQLVGALHSGAFQGILVRRVSVPPPMVVVPPTVTTTLVVVVYLAHERLLAQGCWGTVQMEVVTVDRHELPAPVTIGNVVGARWSFS